MCFPYLLLASYLLTAVTLARAYQLPEGLKGLASIRTLTGKMKASGRSSFFDRKMTRRRLKLRLVPDAKLPLPSLLRPLQ